MRSAGLREVALDLQEKQKNLRKSGVALPSIKGFNAGIGNKHVCYWNFFHDFGNFFQQNIAHFAFIFNHILPTSRMPSGVVLANDFKLFYKIGSGSFGEIFLALNMKTKSEVAVKVESTKTKPQSLVYEAKVYSRIRGGPGIPQVYYFGADRVRELNILVMDLLGPSLEDLFKFCGGKFTYKTTIMLADQMIERVEWLHSKNLIHRDIKPDNFVLNEHNELVLIDFGTS